MGLELVNVHFHLDAITALGPGKSLCSECSFGIRHSAFGGFGLLLRPRSETIKPRGKEGRLGIAEGKRGSTHQRVGR